MTASDADEASAQGDDRGPPRRGGRRDVLEVGKSDGPGRRGLDRDDDDRRLDSRARDRDRRDDSRRDDSRRDDDRRDRGSPR